MEYCIEKIEGVLDPDDSGSENFCLRFRLKIHNTQENSVKSLDGRD